jgi:hypothetical protein
LLAFPNEAGKDMTAKVNLKLAGVNHLWRSQGENLAGVVPGFNFKVNPILLLNSAQRTPSDCQSPSIIFKPQLLVASKFNTSALPDRGGKWK